MSTNNKIYHQLPPTGFLRLRQVLQLIPVGKTSWYVGLARGIYPKPVSLGPRTKGYRIEDIRDLIERLAQKPPTK